MTTGVLALLTVMYFITYLDRVNVGTAALGFGKDFGLSHTEIGLVFSMFAYPYLGFQIIGGWISDRFGAKRTLLVCGLVWSVATILTGLSTGLFSLLACRVLLGLGEGATFPAATAAMARWVPQGRRSFAQGLAHSGSRIGNALAPTIIIALMVSYDWRMSFYLTGAASLLWVLLLALYFTEHPRNHPGITEAELAMLPSLQGKTTRISWTALFRRMFPVALVYFCYGWTLWLFLSWIPQYFLHSHGLDLKNSALFASGVFLAGVLGDTLGGLLSDRILRRTGNLTYARSFLVAAGMGSALLSLLPLLFIHDLYVSLACLSLGFFFAELCIGPMWAIPMDIAPEHAGTASGMMNTGSALAAIISPVASGWLIDLTGNWEVPFVGSMALMGAGMLLSCRMKPGQQYPVFPPQGSRRNLLDEPTE